MYPERQVPAAPRSSGTIARIAAFLPIASLSAACGGSHFYKPTTPHVARVPGAAVDARMVWTQPPSESYPPSGVVSLRAVYQIHPGTALTSPRLAPATSPPCEGGIAPKATADVAVSTR